MRPIKIQLEGFGAFRAATTVDFSDVELVAFVGLTGAGKSTIIDAITFALYGSVARYEKTNLVAPIIHQLSNEAKVRFDFELGNETYTAIRIVRRQKSDDRGKLRATTKEARLEKLSADGQQSQVLAGNVKELDAAVEKIMGLNFAQFTRTVVLPQGEFAKFLKDDPSERQKLIRRLLDLEIFSKIGVKARDNAKSSKHKIEILDSELQRYSTINKESLKEIKTKIKTFAAFKKSALNLSTEIGSVDDQLNPIRNEVTEIDNNLALLDSILLDTKIKLEIDNIDLEAIKKSYINTDKAYKSLRDQLDKIMLEVEESESIDTLKSNISKYEDQEKTISAIKDLKVKNKNLESESTKLRSSLDKQNTVLDDLVEELRIVRNLEHASHLRRTLVKGESCPVCESTVAKVPKMLSNTEAEKLEQKIDNQRLVKENLVSQVASKVSEIAASQSIVEENAKYLADVETELASTEDIELLKKKLIQIEQASSEKKSLETKLRESEISKDQWLTQLQAAEENQNKVMENFLNLRDGVTKLKPPKIKGQALQQNWVNFLSWTKKTLTEQKAIRQTLAEKGKDLAKAKANHIENLNTQADSVGLPLNPSQDLLITINDYEHNLNQELENAKSQIAQTKRLTIQIEKLETDQKVFSSLANHLKSSGFESWLLQETLEDIAERASIRLLGLSDNQYSLEILDRNFLIVDHNNAGETRDVRTLSGGETFLASLALALALSDSITELRSDNTASLGSIFLDEGFGTLDTETLDIAASAIEELSSSGRMVGVITHVRELAERMPTRFEVTKGPNTSYIEKVEI